MNISIPNITLAPAVEQQYVIKSFHAISLLEIFLAVIGYLILVFFYIRVSKNKEKYSSWMNPKGKTINLVKLVNMYMILYPLVIILLAALQIWLASR